MEYIKKNIINFKDKCFGVSIDSFFIKIVQLEKNRSVDEVYSYALVSTPKESIVDGRIVDKQKVADALKHAVSIAGPKKIKTKKAFCAIPESKVFLRVLATPKIERDEIGEAIKWEVEESIPLSIDQVYYDWQLIEETEKEQSVLTVAVSREIVDDLIEVFELAGLELYGMEAESIAMARSLVDNFLSEREVTLIVDLGLQMTNFVVARGNVPFFTSSIPFSSSGVVDAISKTLGVDKREAERIKDSQDAFCCNDSDFACSSIKSYVEGLSREIEKTIDFYQNISVTSSGVNRIILCGGIGLKGVVPYLVKRLNREVYVGNPWINLNFGEHIPAINREQSLQFVSAIGLAMKETII